MTSLAEALRRAARAADRLRAAEKAWRDAVVEAHEAGASLRALAEASGTSHTRIRRLLGKLDDA